MSFFSDMFKGKEAGWETPPDPTFHASPEYDETKGARQNWWQKLQGWGQEPGYGAIAPDWGDIWDTASKRIKQYYWGGPGGQPGIADKVKSSAAQRNVADSPALETELTHMGYQEAGQLGDLSTTMATKEAEFGETGRQNWLQSLMRMAGLQMPGMWQGAKYMPAESSGAAGALGKFGGSILGGWGEGIGEGISDWFGNLGKAT
jgi:hypothetical protein